MVLLCQLLGLWVCLQQFYTMWNFLRLQKFNDQIASAALASAQYDDRFSFHFFHIIRCRAVVHFQSRLQLCLICFQEFTYLTNLLFSYWRLALYNSKISGIDMLEL